MVNEIQYKNLIEPEVLHIPSFKYFNNDWNFLQEYLESEGNPPYTIDGDLDLQGSKIKSLGNLHSVGGNLFLTYSEIKSLGALQSVGGYLNIYESKIESLGNLTSVGSYLSLQRTPLSEKYSREEIMQMVQVDGDIYM
jgi:hypothetical protein